MVYIFHQRIWRFHQPLWIGSRQVHREKRTPTWSENEGLKYKPTDPYCAAFLSGKKLSSLDRLTGGIVMTDQQRYSVNTRREGLRQKLKTFVSYQNNFLGHPAAKGNPNQKKEKIVHGIGHATTTQSQPLWNKAGLSQDSGSDYISVGHITSLFITGQPGTLVELCLCKRLWHSTCTRSYDVFSGRTPRICDVL